MRSDVTTLEIFTLSLVVVDCIRSSTDTDLTTSERQALENIVDFIDISIYPKNVLDMSSLQWLPDETFQE